MRREGCDVIHVFMQEYSEICACFAFVSMGFAHHCSILGKLVLIFSGYGNGYQSGNKVNGMGDQLRGGIGVQCFWRGIRDQRP